MTDPTPESGRELDAAVESEVMGERVAWIDADGDYRTPCGINGCWCQPVPHRSTDIAAAWEIVEKMRERAFVFELAADCFDDGSTAGVEAEFWDDVRATAYGYENDPRVHAETAPLAICKAALAAVRADTEGADAE